MLTTPLLVGLDGEQKMSKSLGQLRRDRRAAGEQFGKLMSHPRRAACRRTSQYATAWPPEQIDDGHERARDGALHPNAAKRLARRGPSSTCTTARARARRPRPSSTGCSRTTRRPSDVPERRRSRPATALRSRRRWSLTGLADVEARGAPLDRRRARCKSTARSSPSDRAWPRAGADVLQNGKRNGPGYGRTGASWVRRSSGPPETPTRLWRLFDMRYAPPVVSLLAPHAGLPRLRGPERWSRLTPTLDLALVVRGLRRRECVSL